MDNLLSSLNVHKYSLRPVTAVVQRRVGFAVLAHLIGKFMLNQSQPSQFKSKCLTTYPVYLH